MNIIRNSGKSLGCGFLMVMSLTMVVTTRVTVNDGAVEFGSASVDADAEAYTKNKHTPMTLMMAPKTSRSVTF